MKSKQGSSERINGNIELLLRAFQSHSMGKQAMMKSKPGSGKRQDRNFEIVVNHIHHQRRPAASGLAAEHGGSERRL